MATFVLGFADLAALIPDIVGRPVEDEYHSEESGDGLQRTLMPNGKAGLMVWRKADNWTAFTDGYRTWINGPLGLQLRLNTELFDWERHDGYGAGLPSPIIERWESPNCWPGRPYGPPIAVVIHTAAGTMAGMESWLANPVVQTSAHYAIGLKESDPIGQLVDLEDRAWHAGILERGHRWFQVYAACLGSRAVYDGRRENPNNWTVGIETEDLGDPAQEVTDAQYMNTLVMTVGAMARYPSIKFLLGHDDISPLSRPNCPGTRWRASGRFERLAADAGLRTLG